ncbi:zinc metalloproteinase nas-7 [Nephila pilipes]|uniref:Metalloendopeptidase n=1 Tax=Nephila pilipes TaxID=299642 RepID=A0A8X6TBE2_NEPPI|nr:zinc metalloproteinase nas-7 [Nephila pilipes]
MLFLANRGIKIIKSKIDEWNDSVKNFKFVPRTMENDYLYIFSGHGCYSYIGRVGGEQYLSLESKICLRSGTILHGMGLTAGLINQQERPDRDKYIKVNFENIPDEWQSQFEKIADKVYFHTHPYDYGSITHYPMTSSVYTDAFEVRQSLVEDNKIGKAKHLSQIDIDKLNSMYNKTVMD